MPVSFDAKWLRRMTDEVARTPMSEPDWDRIEHRLLSRIEQEPAPRTVVHVAPPWQPLLGIAAVAAAIALAASTMGGASSLGTPPGVAPPPIVARVVQPVDVPARRSDTLRAGDTLDARTERITVQHGGWATFSLDPGSRATIDALDEHIDLHLHEGRVAADVDPRGAVDTFTVRVAQTLVSVHGTVFSVEKRADRVLVRVDRGSVVVGPAAKTHGTLGWVLVAPASGTFSTDGARAARSDPHVPGPMPWLHEPDAPSAHAPAPSDSTHEKPVATNPDTHAANPPTVRGPQVTSPVHAGALAPSASSAEPVAPLPEQLDTQLASATLARVTQGIRACYQRYTPSQQGVTVRVQTTIRIEVAPDGHVAFARFDPPLAPAAQICASGVVAQAQFPQAQRQSALRLSLSL